MVSELIFSDLRQNPDAEAEKSMCLCSLKFPLMFFPSEEYRRDISLDGRMFSRLSRAIGTFNNFENIFGAGRIKAEKLVKISQPSKSHKLS